MDTTDNRRNFIKKASIASITAVAALNLPEIISSTFAAEKTARISIANNDIVLFQGDSITDWGRDYKSTTPDTTAMLGSGYPLLISSRLLLDHAGKNLQIWNKGISGQKAEDLLKRWDTDCIDLKPTVLSIMVGVNDFWHRLSSGYKGTIETYTSNYKLLLDKTRQAFPDVQLIIGEPFGVKGVKAVDEKWYPEFDAYRLAARNLAAEYKASFIPYQSIFDKAQEIAPGSYWTIDGVHPSVAGEALMAKAWLALVKS